jgi:uncharacterized protein
MAIRPAAAAGLIVVRTTNRRFLGSVARVSAIFLVRQERGPEWDPARGRREQAGWDEHAAFIDGLGNRVAIGGPIDDVDGEFVVLVVRADDETEASRLFDADPWMGSILQMAAIERWTLWIGAGRL